MNARVRHLIGTTLVVVVVWLNARGLQPIFASTLARNLAYRSLSHSFLLGKPLTAEDQFQVSRLLKMMLQPEVRQQGEVFLQLAQGDYREAVNLIKQPGFAITPRGQLIIHALEDNLYSQADVARFVSDLGHERGLAWMLSLGERYLAAQNYPRARLVYEGILETVPDSAMAHRRLAMILEEYYKDYAGAVAHAQAAIRIQPKTVAEDYYRLGHNLYLLGKTKEAIPTLETARTLNPVDDCVLVDLALAQMGRVSAGDLLALLQEAVRINPENAYAYSFLSSVYLYQKKDLAQAELLAQKALELQPSDTWALYLMIQMRLEQKRPQDALQYAKRGLEISPRHVGFWVFQGDAQAELSQVGAACQSFQQALQLQPSPDYVAMIQQRLKTWCSIP